jgi:hypothetical protein
MVKEIAMADFDPGKALVIVNDLTVAAERLSEAKQRRRDAQVELDLAIKRKREAEAAFDQATQALHVYCGYDSHKEMLAGY